MQAHRRGDWLYWALFAAILALAIAYRAAWTGVLRVPFINPDSASFLQAVTYHPLIPFTEMRTAGAPAVFLLGTAIAGPLGILLVHHALWLGSTLALVLGLRRMGLRLLSLAMLIYLGFNAKAISFEYFAMSEHLSRTLYVFYAAAALATWRNPQSQRLACVIGALVLLNILAKPSAVILLPGTAILYALHAWRLRRDRVAPVAIAGLLSVAVIIAGSAAYAGAFKARYGTFSFSTFEGYNLLSHVGHLIDLDGPAYPEIKRQVAPIIKLYREKYVARGIPQPNWIIYGSTNDELRADFGNVSPMSIIVNDIKRSGEVVTTASVNRVYSILALEGIRAHPKEYLDLAWNSFFTLFRGYSFIYYEFLPSPRTLGVHRSESVPGMRNIIAMFAGKSPPTCDQAKEIAERASWPLRTLMSPAVTGCAPAAYDDPAVQTTILTVQEWYAVVGSDINRILLFLPPWVAGASIILLLFGWRDDRALVCTFFAAFFTVCVFGYGVLLALFNIAEPHRFMVNIQDFIVLAMGLTVAGVGALLRGALTGRGEYSRPAS